MEVQKGESWSAVSAERYSARPVCFVPHHSFLSFVQLKNTCSHLRRCNGVPPAVVLSWSDNNSTTLSFKVTNDSDRWAVCFSSAGASIACRSIRKSDPYSCFHNYPVILNSPRSHRWEWGKDGKAVEASTTLSLSHRLLQLIECAQDWTCICYFNFIVWYYCLCPMLISVDQILLQI